MLHTILAVALGLVIGYAFGAFTTWSLPGRRVRVEVPVQAPCPVCSEPTDPGEFLEMVSTTQARILSRTTTVEATAAYEQADVPVTDDESRWGQWAPDRIAQKPTDPWINEDTLAHDAVDSSRDVLKLVAASAPVADGPHYVKHRAPAMPYAAGSPSSVEYIVDEPVRPLVGQALGFWLIPEQAELHVVAEYEGEQSKTGTYDVIAAAEEKIAASGIKAPYVISPSTPAPIPLDEATPELRSLAVPKTPEILAQFDRPTGAWRIPLPLAVEAAAEPVADWTDEEHVPPAVEAKPVLIDLSTAVTARREREKATAGTGGNASRRRTGRKGGRR